MKYFRKFTILILILTVLSSCEKDEIQTPDNLEQIGVLGEWKLETRTINGISDLAVLCCDYIMFRTDNELDDLKGEFTAFGDGYETDGVFKLNTASNIIHFDYDNSQESYEFQISNDLITFTYDENSQEVIENWRKEE